MATVLAYTSPATGHAFPAAAILEQLAKRGHRVVIVTLGRVVPHLRDAGLHAESIDSDIEAITLDDWRARTQPGGLHAATRTFVARAALDGADLQRAIGSHHPDLVLVDINCWGAQAVAERWGGPWAIFCPYPLAMSSKQSPPFGPGLPPARGALGKMRDAALRPLVYGALGRAMLPGVNDVRRTLDLSPLRNLDDMFQRPPLALYMSAPPFEYTRDDWPDSIVQVGPCEWEPTAAVPEQLDNELPLIVVTTSSEYQADGRLLRSTADGLAGQEVQVVLTGPSQQTLTGLPGNAVSVDFVPHGPLLDRAVCAVTHAGMGATTKALSRAVPVVAVPYGRDQFEVARRVEVAHAGVRLSNRKVSPDAVARAVQQAQGMREGAQRVAAGFQRAGGSAAAAEAIETRLMGRVPRDNLQ
jgi:MGT family glycosyltransferase